MHSHHQRTALGAAFLLAIAGAACSDGSSPLSAATSSGVARAAQVGDLVRNPATGAHFVALKHRSGEAPALTLVEASWGRRVDVYDFDAATEMRTLRLRDVVVGSELDGADYELSNSLATRGENLTIRYAFGSREFADALHRAELARTPIEDHSFAPTELPPFTMVPRNATIVLGFDDLIDAGSVDTRAIELVAGPRFDRPIAATVTPDPSHGALLDGKYYATRVLIDPSARGEHVGLPAAESAASANVGVRIATREARDSVRGGLLRNLAGHPVSSTTSGSVDLNSVTRDVVRAFRSGGSSSSTGDLFQGFLLDTTPPRVLIDETCTLTSVVHPSGAPADEFDVLIRFVDLDCAVRRRPGDVITTSAHIVEVLQSTPTYSRVRVVQGPTSSFGVGEAMYTTPWTPQMGQRPECVLHFSPEASSPPVQGVSSSATIRVRFDEPIDPESVRPFDSFRITRPSPQGPLDTYVVGDVLPDGALREFTFQPSLPLSHQSGVSESYGVDLDGAQIRDLAGNALLDDPPVIHFQLDPSQPTDESAGIALRFAGVDEDGDGRRELRGQFLFDLLNQTIQPRSVARFSAQVDGTQPIVAAMIPLSFGVQTPLSPFGSKSMNVWRYTDVGLQLNDDSTHNLDIEGLWWRPLGGVLAADNFSQFQMSLAHAKQLPDENLDVSLLPSYPQSGLVPTFANNVSSPLEDPLTIVHPKAAGYALNPADVAQTPAGDVIAPWPLNHNVQPGQFIYWTWRDTSKQVVGGASGAGADPARLVQVGAPNANKGFYPAGGVPTIGLPLLMEFRTYPDAGAFGVNSFSIAIAINSSARPYFRSFSTGGVNSVGQPLYVDPDNELVARGAVIPTAPSFVAPQDNVVPFGQADFVVRVSRVHTRWFDTQSSSTQFAQPVLDLSGAAPAGTQLVAAFRGASAITASTTAGWSDATYYDAYGDGYSTAQLTALGLTSGQAFTPQFFPNAADKTWSSNAGSIDGARFVQVRLSFLSDAATGSAQRLDSLGLAYRR